MQRIDLAFEGPFGWFAGDRPSILDAPPARKPGIYLWTIVTEHDGELIYYVGETGREFRLRFAEHLKEQLSGCYRLNDPEAMRVGRREVLWLGLYGRSRETSLAGFVERLPVLAPALQTFVDLVRFHIAAFEGDTRLRKRIEAAIADHLYAQQGLAAEFQEQDIHYDRKLSEEPTVEVAVRSQVRLEGLPELVAA